MGTSSSALDVSASAAASDLARGPVARSGSRALIQATTHLFDTRVFPFPGDVPTPARLRACVEGACGLPAPLSALVTDYAWVGTTLALVGHHAGSALMASASDSNRSPSTIRALAGRQRATGPMGDCSAADAQFDAPSDAVAAPDHSVERGAGSLFVWDRGDAPIRRVNLQTGVVSTYVGGGVRPPPAGTNAGGRVVMRRDAALSSESRDDWLRDVPARIPPVPALSFALRPTAAGPGHGRLAIHPVDYALWFTQPHAVYRVDPLTRHVACMAGHVLQTLSAGEEKAVADWRRDQLEARAAALHASGVMGVAGSHTAVPPAAPFRTPTRPNDYYAGCCQAAASPADVRAQQQFNGPHGLLFYTPTSPSNSDNKTTLPNGSKDAALPVNALPLLVADVHMRRVRQMTPHAAVSAASIPARSVVPDVSYSVETVEPAPWSAAMFAPSEFVWDPAPPPNTTILAACGTGLRDYLLRVLLRSAAPPTRLDLPGAVQGVCACPGTAGWVLVMCSGDALRRQPPALVAMHSASGAVVTLCTGARDADAPPDESTTASTAKQGVEPVRAKFQAPEGLAMHFDANVGCAFVCDPGTRALECVTLPQWLTDRRAAPPVSLERRRLSDDAS